MGKKYEILDMLTEQSEWPLLPVDLQKIETPGVLRKEAQARGALAELKGFAAVIPNQSILINAIALQEAQESSAIENIVTTRDKLYQSLTFGNQAIDAATKEVINYREAIAKGAGLIAKRGLLSISDIVQIQEIIAGNNAGIRRLPGTALVNDSTEEVVYTPPQDYDEICRLLNNFCEYLNGDEDSLWKMAVLHYQFETIHPFYDGNGRTGRILNILYLLLKKHITTPILYLSSYIIKTKNQYYELLQEVRTGDIWENWICYILTGIEETSKQALEKIKAIKISFDSTIEKMRVQIPKTYSKELAELIFENPYSKIEFLVTKLQVNRKTASKYLKEMDAAGILSSRKVGRETLYINDELMGILKR
ncbi:adenosine monophosphate-protein transferase [Spirochaetia bacterium]|nr:adenosine monophosphate-protein transferase [Spirochaetia bacterium]